MKRGAENWKYHESKRWHCQCERARDVRSSNQNQIWHKGVLSFFSDEETSKREKDHTRSKEATSSSTSCTTMHESGINIEGWLHMIAMCHSLHLENLLAEAASFRQGKKKEHSLTCLIHQADMGDAEPGEVAAAAFPDLPKRLKRRVKARNAEEIVKGVIQASNCYAFFLTFHSSI